MDDFAAVQKIFTVVWKIYKRYGSRQLTSSEWQEFVDSGMQYREEFRQSSRRIDLLFRGIFGALQEYYISFNPQPVDGGNSGKNCSLM